MATFTPVQSRGEIPKPRFGHSITYVGGDHALLFGGAIGAAANSSGRYQITNELYSLNVRTMNWAVVQSSNPPNARAAHGSCAVDPEQLVIYGGATGGGQLTNDDLYLFDFKKRVNLQWLEVPIQGHTPGSRYGHSMVFCKPNIVIFGGNDGAQSLNDAWTMNVELSPFVWTAVTLSKNGPQEKPPPRVYHSAAICREGPADRMIVVFGGRTQEQKSLRDTWGLRQHRDDTWSWVVAPVKRGTAPEARFQHSCVFTSTKMVVVGGRDSDVAKPIPNAVYDTSTCEWTTLPESMNAFRHSACAVENIVLSFGGFDQNEQTHPTANLFSLDFVQRHLRSPSPARHRSDTPFLGDASASFSERQPEAIRHSFEPAPQNRVTLAPHVDVRVDRPNNPDFSTLVRKISVERLEDEGRRLAGTAVVNLREPTSLERFADYVIGRLLRPGITPATLEREFNPFSPFCLSRDDIHSLTRAVLDIVRAEPMMLELRTPIKVYGDIHGQYFDLMRMFGCFSTPVSEDWLDANPQDQRIKADLDVTDYLFLGDYVDRGTHSLEVICLLFALKCKYPSRIHLIRGNHEDALINTIYGFKEECLRRLQENPDHPESSWSLINQVFEYMPLGALIEKKILCVHGGIGENVMTLNDIVEIERPIEVAKIPQTLQEQRITDLLWSDPTANDTVKGVTMNEVRDPDGSGHIKKFGPDRVIEFLEANHLEMIIRAHECVMDGFERFAGGRLITLFSATDYCGTHKNAGGMLFIRRDLTILPKVIYPADREDAALRNTWVTVDRPPTPPRRLKDVHGL
ncbi:MAG: hypothetical protein KVP17_004387 [Porospora cf. gigantea B]|uniref:uncharacterized protein n=1 Tax=Porospora cf. gigantea B TaxID=2853592 RepID=UPI003571E563|nr:MAG: hypothetical protein KVP17_004387 [Porospora cf. gigantea B]